MVSKVQKSHERRIGKKTIRQIYIYMTKSPKSFNVVFHGTPFAFVLYCMIGNVKLDDTRVFLSVDY